MTPDSLSRKRLSHRWSKPDRRPRSPGRRAGPYYRPMLAAGIVIGALALTSVGAPAAAGAQQLGDRFLDAAIDSLVAAHMETGQVAGLTVAVARGGTILHHEPYGMADFELGVRTPRDAVYEIGSITKQFTAVLALQLVDEGVLDLDADFTDYYPDFDTGGRVVPLRRLLDHTSGMRSYTEMQAFGQLVTLPLPQDTLVRAVEAHPWDFEPGTALIYNNSAYFILGLLLEEVTGDRYEDLLQERLFEPLGMAASHLCEQSRVVPNRARGYQPANEGFRRAAYLDHRWPYAAGSICSTAADLVRWNQALHGGEVLSPEMYALLVTPEPLVDGSPVRYAKGLVHEEGPHGEIIHHGGGIFGFVSEGRWYPDDETVVVVLQNSTGPRGPSAVADGIADLLRARVRLPFQDAPANVGQLSGSYAGPARGRPMTLEITTENGQLKAAGMGDEPRDVAYLGDGLFGGYESRMWFLDAEGRTWGTPGAGEPVELRWEAASAHYVLTRQPG